MSWFDQYLSRQFANPRGLGGRLVCRVMNRQNRPLYEATLALLPERAQRVLDVGCGNGFMMSLFATDGRAAVGIDPSAEVIAQAGRRWRRLTQCGQLAFALGEAAATGQPGEAFDAAYSVNTVYFWPDLAAGLTEIGRVLKPGGVLVISLYTPEALALRPHTQHGYRKYSPEDLVAAAKSAGFAAKAVPLLTSRAAFSVCCTKV